MKGMRVRTHGTSPHRVAVLHGGPGAAGEVRPVAAQLARARGVLEPLQGADSVGRQVEELRQQLLQWGDPPALLIGHSWGALLAWIFAAEHPTMVRGLVLVSCPALCEEYAADLMEVRRARLSPGERDELDEILRRMEAPGGAGDDALLARFGALMQRADACDLLPGGAPVHCDMHIFRAVWAEAAELRRTGRLLAMSELIRVPVTAVHGACDPSPADGVREPLSTILPDFCFILLPDCGHTPWRERRARDEFFRVVEDIIAGFRERSL